MSFFDGDNQSQDDDGDNDMNNQDDSSSCMDYFNNQNSNINQNINNHADQFVFDDSGLSDYPIDCNGHPFVEQHYSHMGDYFNDENNSISEQGNANNDDCFFNIPTQMDNNDEEMYGNDHAMVVANDNTEDQYIDHDNNQVMNVSCHAYI